jgi:hypothetical protein
MELIRGRERDRGQEYLVRLSGEERERLESLVRSSPPKNARCLRGGVVDHTRSKRVQEESTHRPARRRPGMTAYAHLRRLSDVSNRRKPVVADRNIVCRCLGVSRLRRLEVESAKMVNLASSNPAFTPQPSPPCAGPRRAVRCRPPTSNCRPTTTAAFSVGRWSW